MPSYTNRPFQQDYIKNANIQSVFKKTKSSVRHDIIQGERREQYKKWITFYRRNPHRFIKDYFGITLFPYQILIIWILQKSNLAYIVASRAAGKTWLIAVWALTLCVLYPGIKVVVCAKTLKQGGVILSEKLTQLRDTYPNVQREIDKITSNANVYEAMFHCGSTIQVVPSSESARNRRANYIVVEEARLVPKEILEQVIKPFLFSRMPLYRLKKEYKDDARLREEGIISYITSAWYTAEYWYTYVKACIRRMAEGDETANFMALDYLVSVHHNIKTEQMIKNEMEDSDPISNQMEYLNIPSGASGKSYFKPTMFPRNIKRAFYPQKDDNFNTKKNPYEVKKVEGEMRIICADIATRANKQNDLSITGAIRLIPLIGKGYNRQLVYMESFKGANTIVQAKRIKQLFYDFESDYLVIDVQSAGIGVIDSLGQVTIDEDRGINYEPFTVVDESVNFLDQKIREELRARTLGIGARPVIFPISATQILNSQIASAFRASLQKKLWSFLIADGEAEEFLIKTNKEFTGDPNDSSAFGFFLNPYVQTGLFIGECINLDMTLVNGLVKLVEKPGTYKDRYSSISYANWFISYFDRTLLKETEEYTNELSDLLSVTQFV